MELKHQLTPKLKQLRLSGILQTLDSRHRQAVDGKWSYVEFLERLLEDEVERRQQKQLSLRLRRSGVNTAKTIETFDFDFNPAINRQQILALAACDFIREKRNALLCGPTGVGKTHISEALSQEACRQGFQVLFVNAYKMLQHLNGGRADGSLERRLKTYLRPDLLVLDDFGLKPLSPRRPTICMMSSTSATKKGRFYSPATAPHPNGWAYSGTHCLVQPGLTVSATGPRSSSSAVTATAPKVANFLNRRCF